MKKVIILSSIFFLIISCKQKETKAEEKPPIQKEQESSMAMDDSKIGRKNYVVIWKWATSDTQLVKDNLVTISDEVNSLWKDDIITDAYYNSDSKIDKLAYFPNVSFVIKAKSLQEAEEELNRLTLVQKSIASYSIYPVGTKWLHRDSDKINAVGVTPSYAAVWTTKEAGKASNDLIKAQGDAILKLWNEGKIENVYFDIEGTQKLNDVTDFVFFINANTEEEADALCKALPFATEDIASFKLYSIGVFWLGDDNK